MSTSKNAWQAPVFNFAGVALFDEIDEIMTGNYRAVLVESDYHTKAGETVSSSIIFRLRIVEGVEQQTENGKVAAKWCGLTQNEGNARNWKSAYVSFGYNPQTLEQSFAPQPGHFPIGKDCYLHIITPPLPEGVKRDAKSITCNFISPQAYAERKAAAGHGKPGPGFAATGPGPGLPGAAAQVAQPGFGAPVQPAPVAPQQQVTPPPQLQPTPQPTGAQVIPITPQPPNGGSAGPTLFENPPTGQPAGQPFFGGPGPSA